MPLIVQLSVLLQNHAGCEVQHAQAVVPRVHEEPRLKRVQSNSIDNDALDLANLYLSRAAPFAPRRHSAVPANRPEDYQPHVVGRDQVTVLLEDDGIDKTFVTLQLLAQFALPRLPVARPDTSHVIVASSCHDRRLAGPIRGAIDVRRVR